MEEANENDEKARQYSAVYQDKEFPSKYQELKIDKKADDVPLVLAAIHEIVSGLKKGGRMLDFGCGPIIYNVASASRYFQEIIMADYSDCSRKEVKKWLTQGKDRLDWKPLLDVVAELEGYSCINKGTEEIEKRIRSSVKKVIQCDILSDPPIPEEYGKFDLLLTSFCIECMCITSEMYMKFISRLCALIRNDGTMIIVSIINGGLCEIHKVVYGYSVSQKLIKESLENCGLKLNSWNFIECKGKRDYCDFSGIVVASAKKEYPYPL